MSPRRRRGFRATSGVALLAAAALLAACSSSGGATPSTSTPPSGSAPASTLPKTLVFSPLSLAPAALKGLAEGVKGYGSSQGWKVIVQDPNFDAAKQVQQLTEVIDSGVAGAVWTLANSPSSMGSIITSAQAKGVPILVNGQPSEWGFDGPQVGVTFDYIDYGLAGTNMGTELGKCVNDKLGGTATVLFGNAAAGSAGKEEYEKSALAALAATAPNAKVVQQLVTTDRAKAQTDIGNALQGQPGINAFMAPGDEGPLAAIGAFAAAGKPLPCVVAGTAGNPETLAAVKSGKMYAVVALQFDADLKQSFDTLATMQQDPTAKGLILTVPQKIITAAG